ncbi:MAG: aldehyde dehydrogenase family protein [Lachnospiraceae bacterium]|nr:aldehyde dehydrogenase family protein [Lachnospiraceae bacterium]HCJ09193.1 aldehyde dehydrogenase family protein [Lachnospiraceae bacterium]
MEKLQLYIGGQWVDGHSGEYIYVENPAKKEMIAAVPKADEEDVQRAVKAAKSGYEIWRFYSGKQRAECLYRLADFFEVHQKEIASTVTQELGAPVSMAEQWHVAGAAGETRFFAKLAEDFAYETRHSGYILRREPYGIVAGITPWNYPLDQITLKILPALAAGNCVILKPSQMAPLTAYWFTRGIEEAGFPAGVLNLVTGCGGEVGNVLALHPDIRMLSFTGSTSAGREVGRLALSNIKKCTLELGGKSAAIVLQDADYEMAVDAVLTDCFMNTGQTCNAITRLLIPASAKEEMEELAIARAREFVVGDPQDPNVDIGPLVSQKAYNSVAEYIKKGLEEGASMIAGKVPDGAEKGYYIQPVIFSDVRNDMTIAKEEIFGPVLCMITYDSLEEAIAIANDSEYGLCGGVFGPEKEAIEVARQMETGVVCINGSGINSGAPFGGYKQSGIGRESCEQSMDEYMEIKAICIPMEG